MWGDTARTLWMILRSPSGVAWAVFMRTTFMPALKRLRIKSTSHLKSLIEHTIFVCFMYDVIDLFTM